MRERGSSFAGGVGAAAHALAELPLVFKRLRDPDSRINHYAKRFDAIPSGWSFGDAGAPGLDGYVLLSRIDGDLQRQSIELVSLSDMKTHYTWLPDVNELMADVDPIPQRSENERWTLSHFQTLHPFVNADGGLILKDNYSPMVRTDACSHPMWLLADRIYSHSTEVDANGDFWVPAHPPQEPDSRWPASYANDSLDRVTLDGKRVESISLTKVFTDHDLLGKLFPILTYYDDPLHLNDIQPVLEDGPFWKKGDLFVNLRGPSMVMLYRPSTNEIIWMKEGPWLKQHDVDILDDHRISVFSNNVRDYGKGTRVEEVVDVMIYDFSTGEVTRPWRDAFLKYDVETTFAGLSEVLPGGNLMVEETFGGRLLIFDKDGNIVQQYLNRAGDGQVYAMAWTRYIEPSVGDALVKVLEKVNCNG
ncbi:arylsulfotransferase family protein [Defluviimonas aestuarii]|uniref:arylsulfotransferase family protein n=1 Tax=Albidovulum aestuarii TaxID=1130726 RepID=UPI00249C1482|nr:arylsulfotransferase family protein [Defluviimonas aestuarii]MDI3338406.1 arylsulfotransferase family protein [Defluviimonas aestuarii]